MSFPPGKFDERLLVVHAVVDRPAAVGSILPPHAGFHLASGRHAEGYGHRRRQEGVRRAVGGRRKYGAPLEEEAGYQG